MKAGLMGQWPLAETKLHALCAHSSAVLKYFPTGPGHEIERPSFTLPTALKFWCRFHIKIPHPYRISHTNKKTQKSLRLSNHASFTIGAGIWKIGTHSLLLTAQITFAGRQSALTLSHEPMTWKSPTELGLFQGAICHWKANAIGTLNLEGIQFRDVAGPKSFSWQTYNRQKYIGWDSYELCLGNT